MRWRTGVDAAPGVVAGRTSEPSGWRTLRRILPPEQVASHEVFVDFGSGKGRVLLEASRYPFQRLVGVEISDALNEIARTNLEAAGVLNHKPVELVTVDVREYAIPDDITVAYFYNPFHPEVFAQVIDGLAASAARRPRALRIVYRNPKHEHHLLSRGFRLVRTRRGLVPWAAASSTRLYEWESRPGPAPGP